MQRSANMRHKLLVPYPPPLKKVPGCLAGAQHGSRVVGLCTLLSLVLRGDCGVLVVLKDATHCQVEGRADHLANRPIVRSDIAVVLTLEPNTQ